MTYSLRIMIGTMASIGDIASKINPFRDGNKKKRSFSPKDLFYVLVVILVTFLSYGLGRISALPEKEVPVMLKEGGKLEKAENESILGLLVGSRRGSKYHYPWCPGALTMKESNKVWFSSVEEARSLGYTPAGNCEGL